MEPGVVKRRSAVLALSALAVAQPVRAQTTDAAQARLDDSADGGGPGGGTFFVLTAIDGRNVDDNALTVSRRASAGRGAWMVVRPHGRALPAGKVRLKLMATQTHAAPVQQIFTALFRGGAPEASGEVEVELAPGGRYRVTGALDSLRREVWIEDASGRELPGSRVVQAPDPELLKAMEGAAYTTVNLRYDGDWIGDGPALTLPMVPIGSRIKVQDWGRGRAPVLVDGRKMRVGVDYGGETIQQFVGRITSATDPRPALAALPDPVRLAIRSGRVLPGMSRQLVEMALGRPRPDLVPSFDAAEWVYPASEDEVILVFGADGNLKEVDASRKWRQMVLYTPPT